MLWAVGFLVIKPLEQLVGIVWHADVQVYFFVVPVQRDSTAELVFPIIFELVGTLLEGFH